MSRIRQVADIKSSISIMIMFIFGDHLSISAVGYQFEFGFCRSTRLSTFPDYLMVHLKKFTIGDDWVPKKLGKAMPYNIRKSLVSILDTITKYIQIYS